MAALAFFYGAGTACNLHGLLCERMGYRLHDSAHWQDWIGILCRVWAGVGRFLGVVHLEVREPGRFAGLRGHIVAANHPSLVDAFALLTVVPRGVCVMRSDLRRNPALGVLARLAGYISNDCGPALVRGGIRGVSRGENLLVFPEGTRSREGGLRPFRGGFALIAIRSGAPIQTVRITLEGEFFRKGRSLLAPALLPIKLTIEPGACFHARKGERPEHLAARVEDYFRSGAGSA